jgi:hypothetical protein
MMSNLLRPCWVSLAWAAMVTSGAADEKSWSVTVRGNGNALGEVPLVAALPEGPAPGLYTVESNGERGRVPALVFDGPEGRCLGLVVPRLDAGATATLRLRPFAPGDRRRSGVTIAGADERLRVLVDGRPFTEYRSDEGPKPILWPLIGPTGQPFTRAFPMEKVEGEDQDHPHQRSFWLTHGSVNGVDFWSEQGRHGTIRETSRRVVRDGGMIGAILTTNDWLGPDGAKVCSDQRVLTFYNTDGARVLDFDVTISATSGPVTFGDTKEGSFGLRVASSMDVKRKRGGKITNAEGLTDGDAWGKPSPWVDYVGPVQGKTVGVAILNHPESFRFPTTWHVRDYGLFAANPFGYRDFGRNESGEHTIPADGSMRLRYRVILHEGDTPSAKIAEAFEAYARPPKVEVLAE